MDNITLRTRIPKKALEESIDEESKKKVLVLGLNGEEEIFLYRVNIAYNIVHAYEDMQSKLKSNRFDFLVVARGESREPRVTNSMVERTIKASIKNWETFGRVYSPRNPNMADVVLAITDYRKNHPIL